MQQKKNIAPLICGIIGTVFGLVGGFLWVACSDCAYYGLPLDTIWLLLFILFGLGGPVLGLIGSILAFVLTCIGIHRQKAAVAAENKQEVKEIRRKEARPEKAPRRARRHGKTICSVY